MWSGAWNKAHFRNLLPNRFLPRSVGKALAWRSGGPGFQPHWGQFLTKFILFCVTLNLSDNLTKTPNVKNSTGCVSFGNLRNAKSPFSFVCKKWSVLKYPARVIFSLSHHEQRVIFDYIKITLSRWVADLKLFRAKIRDCPRLGIFIFP